MPPAFWRNVECGSELLEKDVEKIAVYALNATVTHAARQLPNGRWTSKLGQGHDISHTLQAIAGGAYGSVAAILKRSVRQARIV